MGSHWYGWGTLFLLSIFSVSAGASGITYQGRLLKPDSTPVTSSNIQFRIQIRTPGLEDCLLYEEVQTKDLSATSGVFALSVGDGTGTRTDAHTSDWNLFEALSNRKDFNFSSAECTAGSSYSPNPTDNRKFRVFFDDGSGTGWQSLPTQVMNYLPMAIQSYAVGGFSASSLLRVEDAGNLVNTLPLSNAQYTELLNLLSGSSAQYEKSGELGGSALPTLTNGQTMVSNGSGWTAMTPLTSESDPNVSAFAKTSLPTCGVGEVLKSDGTVLSCVTDTSGTLPNVGTPGTYTKVTTDAQGRVTSGSQITGSDITSGTIGGSTAVNTSGDITSTGDLSISGSATTGSFSTRQFDLYDSDNTNKISFLTPATGSLTTDYNLVFPATLGSSNQILGMNNAGDALENKSITAGTGVTITHTTGGIEISATGSGGTVTSVTGTAPISVDNTDAANPIVTLSNSGVGAGTYGSATEVPVFTVDATGRVTSVTDTTISGVSPVGAALTTGKVWMGNSGAAQEKFINISDVRSSKGPGYVPFFPTTCSNSQTMTWQSTTDTMVCADISIASAQVTGLDGSLDDKVDIAGDTMTGTLNLPSNGLTVGTNQLVVSGGNVGVGTTTASYPLTVKGDIYSSTGVFRSGTSSTYNFVSAGNFKLDASAGGGGELAYRYGGGGGWSHAFYTGQSSTVPALTARDGGITVKTSSSLYNPLQIDENSNHLMTVTGAGKVGIGTTAPSSPLTVNGVIESKSGGIKFPDGTTQTTAASGGGAGDVTGPSSSTDNALARFDSTTGKLIQDSNVTVDDSGNLSIPSGAKYQSSGGVGTNSLILYNGGGGINLSASAAGSKQIALSGANVLKGFNSTSTSYALNAVNSSNTSLLYVRNDGNVGIGTTTPSEKLEVNGKVKATELCIGTDCKSAWPSGGGSGDFMADGSVPMTGSLTITGGSNGVYLPSNSGVYSSSSIMYLHSSVTASVGSNIGSSGKGGFMVSNSHGYHFSSGSNAYYAPDLSLLRDAAGTLAIRNSTNAQGMNIYNTYTDSANYERGFLQWNTNLFTIGTEKAGTGVARDLALATDGSEHVRITSSGNVGIGTDSPSSLLEVDGVSRLNGQVIAGSHVTLSNSSAMLRFRGSDPSVTSPAAHELSITTNSTERLRIDSSGNVGIGTTTPSEKLEVNGNVKATQLCIGSDCRSTWPSASGSGALTIVSKTTDFSVTTSDLGKVFVVNNASSAGVTLPSAAVAGSGFRVTIKHVGTGMLYFNPALDNCGSSQLGARGSVDVVSTGTEWISLWASSLGCGP